MPGHLHCLLVHISWQVKQIFIIFAVFFGVVRVVWDICHRNVWVTLVGTVCYGEVSFFKCLVHDVLLLSQSKIAYLEHLAIIYKNVGWFDIPMN